MNGYLRSKCSSEQQLLNELAKLLGTKDVASRKMADVLRALTFFYTSAGRGARIPLSLLSGLCTLLPQLKDKKEITLLKDEHQRIARVALCLLTRLIDQFEIQKEMTTRPTDAQKINQNQSVDAAEQVLANFLLTLETAVTTPSGLLLPRQRSTLRVYAQLCRVFQKREHLVSYTAALLQQSPVLAYAGNSADAKGKRLPPPVPAQFGAVAGACHAVRFHTEPEEQACVANKLAQLAFMIPAGPASRHAAKTLLSLLMSPVLSEDRPSSAVTVAKAIELFLLEARPRSLLGGDSMTSVYLLRLCGQMFRLPAHQLQQQNSTAPNDSGLFNIISTLGQTLSETASEQSHDQNPALQGFLISNALSAQLEEYLMDVIQTAIADDTTTKAGVAPAVILVAVEEALRGTSPKDSFRKQPNWGSKCIFEVVATALLPLLPATLDPSGLLRSTVTLHRVCRAVQFVAEHIDAGVLRLGPVEGQKMEIPTYLSQLTLRIHSLTEHSNAFVACEALRAFVWLLPRYSSAELIGDSGGHWTSIFWQLETLPFGHIQPERRAAIAWTLFRRCVTTLKSYGYQVEKPLLLGCLRVVLAWFRVRPCVWHAALLTAIWHTALPECAPASLGEVVFSSINEVLDYQCAPTSTGASDSLVVKQCTLQFLSNRKGCLKHAVQSGEWSHALILRLAKQALLETAASQRMSIRALAQIRDEAHAQGLNPIAQHANAVLSFAEKTPRQARQQGVTSGDGFHNQLFTLREDPFSGGTAQDVLDDPFSDFRVSDETIAPTNVATTANEKTEDPFGDHIGSAASGVFSWNDTTSERGAAATVLPSLSDSKTYIDRSTGDSTWSIPTTFNELNVDTFRDQSPSPFSAWEYKSINQAPPTQSPTQGPFFGAFTASETTRETSFGGWGEGGTSEPQQQGFTPSEDFSGSFDAAISAPRTTPTESESVSDEQIEQGDPADAPMVHTDPASTASADAIAFTEMVLDAEDETANFSTPHKTTETSFGGWGEGGTSEPQQQGFTPSEDFSGSFDAAISAPRTTPTESESVSDEQIEQGDPADAPMVHTDPASTASADAIALTEMVLDAEDETANFSTPHKTTETSFGGWGEGGTSEPQQQGFTPSEDFSGSFDAAISAPRTTPTESESVSDEQIEQGDPADAPMVHTDPASTASADAIAFTEMVLDAEDETANFSTPHKTTETSFGGWGEGGTSEPQQQGFTPSEDFSGSFDAAISAPRTTPTESESVSDEQIEQGDPADAPMVHTDPASTASADAIAFTEMVLDAEDETANFSTPHKTTETSFGGWGEGGTSEPQQQGFTPSEDFSGSFDAAISAPRTTPTESESVSDEQIEQGDPADAPMVHTDPASTASADAIALTEMVLDAEDETANFSTPHKTTETSFGGWGEGGTSEPQQQGFTPSEDFSGSFDAAISAPRTTPTESESVSDEQIEQGDPADAPMVHTDPASTASADAIAFTEMVLDAEDETANFSTPHKTTETSFGGWGEGGTSEPQQQGFTPSEDFSGSFDAAISAPRTTPTESESVSDEQIEQGDPADAPMVHTDPASTASADAIAFTEMVLDAEDETANFSTPHKTTETSFGGWGEGGTSEPQQQGFTPSEDFSGSFDAAISAPRTTPTESESVSDEQIEQGDPADAPMVHTDPASTASADAIAFTEMVLDAEDETANFSTPHKTTETSFGGWGEGGTSEPQQQGFTPSEDFSGSFDAAISAPRTTPTESESVSDEQIEQGDPADAPMVHTDPASTASADAIALTEMVLDAEDETANFSTPHKTTETSFGGWGEGGTSEPQQQGFTPSEDFSGSFDAAISAPRTTPTESESVSDEQIEQGDPADAPMVHTDPASTASADAIAFTEMVLDAEDETANFSTPHKTTETSFGGWGEGGTSEPQQQGFTPSEDFSGSFDAAISAPRTTPTESESVSDEQIEQGDPADAPMVHTDPASTASADAIAFTEMVLDAEDETANFSTPHKTTETSFGGWGEGGTSEPQQQGFTPSEDFSGSFDAAISAPRTTPTESESVSDEQIEQDAIAFTEMVLDAEDETANFSTPHKTTETSFGGWGEGGTSEPQQQGFTPSEDFSGSFGAAISAPRTTPTESESVSDEQIEQGDPADAPMVHTDPASTASADAIAFTEMVLDAEDETANFSTPHKTTETSFGGWGEGGTSEPQQQGFTPSEDFSGSFGAAISAPRTTPTESESVSDEQIEQCHESSTGAGVALNYSGSAQASQISVTCENFPVAYNESNTAMTSRDEIDADLEFNDISGGTDVIAQDASYTPVELENNDVTADDLEFKDIFGEAGAVGHNSLHVTGSASTATKNGAQDKDTSTGVNQNAASGIELRSVTPASDLF
ncbi:hypothetical protein GN958_ATG19110 [Phytophthora infestans]|uniref:Uncharacterized protein n=1 Tax=Phytophthora infestans TaxID=4787 RepID=A0A8S9TXB1_PHYIN|nr:hypothetical protein GN958_ATG19110 [Phytophthora infestans]